MTDCITFSETVLVLSVSTAPKSKSNKQVLVLGTSNTPGRKLNI